MVAAFFLNVLIVALSLASVTGAAVATPPTMSAPAILASPQFRRYGVADGLPSGTVYAVVQDHNGLMWFASSSGLVRYDGVEFTAFRHIKDDPNSVPSGSVFTLFVDRDNHVWGGGISTGLMVYDQHSASFQHWVHDDSRKASLASNEVWSMAQTTDGDLWVATQAGLDHLRLDGRGFDHVRLGGEGNHLEPAVATRALLADAGGRLWIGAANGLYLRQANGLIRHVPVDPAFKGDVGTVWRIDGGHGEVRVAVSGGLLVIGSDGVARPQPSRQLLSARILGSARDAQGRLWIATDNGMLLDQGGGHLLKIVGQPLLPGGLPGSKAWQVFVDREGGLWIALEESSIAYLAPTWSGFTRFTHVPDDPNSLSDIAAATIFLGNDGKLLVGGDSAWIDKLDVATGKVQHIVKGSAGQIVALTQDSRGNLWVAVPGRLVLANGTKLVALGAAKTQLTRPVLLCRGQDGIVYVASWGEGVFAIHVANADPSKSTIQRVPIDKGTSDTVLPDQLTLHAGELWYASVDGLMRMDETTHRLSFVPGTPRTEILSFAFDRNGIWIATQMTIEHYRYIKGRAEFDERIDTSNVAAMSTLTDLRVDQQGQLWLFANPGLWRLDQKSKQFESFGPTQGLSNAAFSSGAITVGEDGTFFAATSGGVIAFQPRQFVSPPPMLPHVPVTFTQISVRRAGQVQSLLQEGSALQMGWRDHDLHVEARVGSFINPMDNRYRFHLSRIDSGWVDMGNRGERDFVGLGAGDYKLNIMAAGASTEWSSLSSPLTIHVQAPPWQRWWAWLIYMLLAALCITLVLRSWRSRLAERHRVQMLEQERQLAESASAAKTQFLATLSHEIRTPMTGVMGMAELLLSTPLSRLQRDYTEAMQRSGGMLLKLLNDALDLARIEAGRLELELAPFDPRQLLDDVVQLEQGLAHAKGLRLVLHVDGDIPSRIVGDAIRIKQILLNLSNNALKFTEQGQVMLSARRIPSGLMFSVSDTGPGIPEASQTRLFQRFEQVEGPYRRAGSGLGLAICRELVEMMGGSIELESRQGYGSVFHVRLPLSEPAAASSPSVMSVSGGKKYNVLLVEDDTIVAAVIRGMLAQHEHTVTHVVNGLAALTELEHLRFDAVLLDLDLPGVDGFQVAQLIRQRELEGQHMPIVAVTARAEAEDEAQAFAAGMDAFLRKPLTGEQLAEVLARVLAVEVDVAETR